MDAAARAGRGGWVGRVSDAPRRAVSGPSEAALVRAAQAGSAEAFEELFRRFWPAAHRAALLITRDAAAADDVAQEAFVAAEGALDRFDPARPFGPWLHRIVVNRALDWTRASRRRREVADDGWESAAAAAAASASASVSTDPGLDDTLLAALAELGPEQRAVLVLRHVLGFTPGEIATALDLPRGTVNSRLRRGLDNLRLMLAAAVVVLAAAAALAFTPPGDAVAQFLRRIVSVAPAPRGPVAPAGGGLAALPAAGRLLVTDAHGAWIAGGAAQPTRLGAFAGVTWSPHGRYVAGWRGRRLTAVDTRGRTRWAVTAPAAVHDARWAPDGFLVAYRSGGRLWLVAGDGSGAHALGASAALAPAWRPGAPHALAWITPAGRILVVDAARGGVLWRSAARFPRATGLSWSAHGTRLAIVEPHRLTVVAVAGKSESRVAPPGRVFTAAAWAPEGSRLAAVETVTAGSASRVVRFATGAHGRQVAFTASGRFTSLAWSPDGAWILAGWPHADQWLMVPSAGAGAAKAVAGVTRLVGARAFPDVSGWCCAVPLALAKPPVLGVACPAANSIACDRVRIAVFPRGRIVRMRATIGATTIHLHRTRGWWQGELRPAGLGDPASPLHVTPDRGDDYWAGRHRTTVAVRITARLDDGRLATRTVTTDLRPGWG